MRLLTPREVADLLRVAYSTLESWRRAGTGPPITKIGHSVRYGEDELWQWIRAQEWRGIGHDAHKK